MTLRETLDEIRQTLAQIVTWQAVHDQAHETIGRDLTDVRETIYGNPGIRDKVLRLWACKKSIAAGRDFWLGVLKYVISVGIVAIIVWGLTVYKTQPVPAQSLPQDGIRPTETRR